MHCRETFDTTRGAGVAYPVIYDVTYSYTGFQQAQGDDSFPGTQLDADLAGLESSISSLALFIEGVLRSDGKLANGSVDIDQLSLTVRAQIGDTTAVEELVEASDQAVASAAAAATSATNAATAEAGAVAAAASINNQAFTFDTVALATAAHTPAGVNAVRLVGYASAGDGGGALYRKAGAMPAHLARFQSADGAWWELAEDEPNILQYGGSDNGVAFNDTAWAAAKSQLVGSARRLKLPKLGIGRYAFNPAGPGFNPAGVVIDADPGVTISGPVVFDPAARSIAEIPVNYSDNTGFAYNGYGFSSKWYRPVHDKEMWLNVGDLERKYITGYDMSTLGCVTADFTTGDTFATDVSAATNADTVTVNLANDGQIRGALLVPVRGGDEVSISFIQGNFVRMALIRFAGGWHAFYANNAQGILRTKLIGSAAADSAALSWFGLSNNPAWAPDKADWKVRINDSHSYSILFNGMEIIERQPTPGAITDAGFAMLGVAAVTGSMQYFSKVRRSEAAGRSPMRLLVIGDSKDAPIAGGWVDHAVEILEGSAGLRVWEVHNIAVPGNTSTDQYNALVANTALLPSITHVVIDVGANDDQSGGAGGTLTNITNMITLLITNGINLSHIILNVPYLWYTEAMSGGGFNAGANDQHGRLRAGIRRLAGVKGCGLVDLTEVMAAVTPDDLAVAGRDPQVRDNIHETLYAQRKIGVANARALLAGTVTEMTQREPLTAFHSSWLKNSWTLDATFPASYSVSRDGVVNLAGVLDKGTVAEPVIIATLPRNLCPTMTLEFNARTNTGSVTVIYIGVDGSITLSSFPGAATYVSLANISFQLPPF